MSRSMPTMSSLTTHHLLPPFPSDLSTVSLDSISLDELQSSNPSQAETKLFAACQDIGFFYLPLEDSELGRNILREAEDLHALQQRFFALPSHAKDEYGRDKVDPFFSYRWTPCPDGVGRREMYSLRVDDFLRVRQPLPRHPMISSIEPLLASFALHCRQVVQSVLGVLEKSLALPAGALLALHRDDAARGDFIALQHRASEPADELMIQNGEHTDFGSITILFNWLGGLQIREQTNGDGIGEWLYVKPIPGSVVVNLGDSMVKLTAGLLRSNIHRVAPSPGLQAGLPRYSLVYFSHPNDDVPLTPVKGGLVDAAQRETDETGEVVTAADWTVRRSLGDLRGVYTYKGGVEWRDNSDAVPAPSNRPIAA
ncbi:hypothetical protein BDY17DRAFT_297044 [Neohortaea acidophila]|uniref:Fe2OG dioxygenase domain-containing protein n=1 Tax=Neohortaea acidophila TaxID=245834 RepID=A0A6A6PU58_9PEZI|nr:uncharacterized protein BDY17DRAFT_297044 [Neohortaea acidophila]KAF2483221.1 hypothetical protein BDY17DRAFT_297044 [Neohortaea acidophila]